MPRNRGVVHSLLFREKSNLISSKVVRLRVSMNSGLIGSGMDVLDLGIGRLACGFQSCWP